MEPWEGCHRRQSLGKTGNPLRNSRWPLSCCDLEGGLPEGPSIYVFHSLNNDVLIFFWCLVHVSYHACLNVMYLTISQIGGHRIMWFRITYTPATDDTKIRDQNITFEKFCPSTPPPTGKFVSSTYAQVYLKFRLSVSGQVIIMAYDHDHVTMFEFDVTSSKNFFTPSPPPRSNYKKFIILF